MQELDNNIDELIRKAAENYGLKDGESQWDAIGAQLPKIPIASPVTAEKKRSKRSSLLLLLLIPLFISGGFIATNLWVKNDLALQRNQQKETNPPTTINQPKKNNENVVVQPLNKLAVAKPQENYSTRDAAIVKTASPASQSKQTLIIENHIDGNENESLVDNTNKTNDKQPQLQPYFFESRPWAIDMFGTATSSPPAMSMSFIPSHFQQRNNIALQIEVPQSDNAATKQTTKNKKGIYAGIIGGPSLQEVKGQGMKKLGFNVGLAAGYWFGNKTSIESGLFFAKRYYHSQGRYFNPAKTNTSMPVNMNVLSLEGSSAVFELPIAIKYDAINTKKYRVFSKAGISSFLLTSEKNNYRVVLNGTEQNMTSIYSENYRYLAAALNFSVGYEHKISKVYSLRIEPYVQLPLKGTGIGAMPVMSSGLHIGFTRLIR
jgi:hypothetical protein